MITTTTVQPSMTIELDDDFLFLQEDSADEKKLVNPWKLLIVDDEPEIHNVTKLALTNFQFDGRGLQFTHAYSAAEAKEILLSEPNFALVLLDVVMETDDAGLQVVDYIRQTLGYQYIRIVLRTGQPGVAPEEIVVNRYDIDDYKAKTELTAQKLHTTVVSSLRAFRELQKVDRLVREKTEQLATLNNEMMESILAARRIQTAILPSHNYIHQFLPHFFVFHRPKDIVSGDFYWYAQIEGKSIIANYDCTGHGIPGAFMTVFGFNLLNQIVRHDRIMDPAGILFELDTSMRNYFMNVDDSMAYYGMDMSVVVIDHDENLLHLAGANHSIFLYQNKELLEIEGDKMPVGESMHMDKEFKTHSLPILKGDRLFMFTDGITDQFGGDRERKFSRKRFKELLREVQSEPLERQIASIARQFDEWKGDNPQTDDVLFIGLQLA